MIKTPTYTDRAWALSMLSRGCIRAITPNMQMITLSYNNACWIVDIYLEHEDKDDAEYIDDIVTYFEIYMQDLRGSLSSGVSLSVHHNVFYNQPLPSPDGSNTQVFFRRAGH